MLRASMHKLLFPSCIKRNMCRSTVMQMAAMNQHRYNQYLPRTVATRGDGGNSDHDFLIRPATTMEEYDFAAKSFMLDQRSIGAHAITHVAPIIQPGFLIGYLNGQRIGSISACKYGDSSNDGFAFLGSYTIIKPFRGRGYGRQLLEAAHAAAARSRGTASLEKEWNIGFDALRPDLAHYFEEYFGVHAKLFHKAYTLSCSKVIQAFQGGLAEWPYSILKVEPPQAPYKFNFSRLSAYDACVFGCLRSQYLKKWITIPESTGLIATNTYGDIIGYAVMQPNLINKAEQLIGPMFTNNDIVTRLLLNLLAKEAVCQKGTETLRLVVPVEANPGVTELLEKEIGYNSSFEVVRMYTKSMVPSQDCMRKKIIAVTSTALG